MVDLQCSKYAFALQQENCANNKHNSGQDVRQIGKVAEEVQQVEAQVHMNRQLRCNGC